LRLRDLPALYRRFDAEIFLRSAGRPVLPFRNFLSFWRWFRGKFPVVYLVELPTAGMRRVVGFVGLYDFQPGRTVSLSMAIFDPVDRRRRYGAQSIEMLCAWLSRRAVARVAVAEVLRDNTESLRFVRAAGFAVRGERDGHVVLERGL
jgi:RimJ/RimL family protein N-acetyltransferase